MKQEIENKLEEIRKVVDLIVTLETVQTTTVTTSAKDNFYSEAGELLNKLLLSFKR